MSISIAWLPGIVVLCVALGFAFRSRQIKKSKKRIIALENEMLNNHAEILKLQRELVTLTTQNSPGYKSRVVPMNELSPEETQEAKDIAQRKKNIK